MSEQGIIRTVTGDLPAASLGWTMIHEHLICDLSLYWTPEANEQVAGLSATTENIRAIRMNPFAVRDNLQLDQIAGTIRELVFYATVGGGTIVEITSHGIGRDIKALEYIARASGIQIIAGCGYYIGQGHPRSFEKRSIDDLTNELIEELTVGINGGPIRAGVIGEIGVGSYPMQLGEHNMLLASVRAQLATGAGMIIHPAPGTESAFEIVRVLSEAGASMHKIVISHLDERFRSDLGLFRRMGQFGVLFGFDTFGRELYFSPRRRQHPSDTERIETIVRLWDGGLGEKVVLAQDICMRHELASLGGQGYSYVLEYIVPRLREQGIPAFAIDQMLCKTPSTVLKFA